MGCPACNDFTYEYLGGQTATGLDRYSQEGMPRMVVHNTHLYCEIVKDINKLTHKHTNTNTCKSLTFQSFRSVSKIAKIKFQSLM